MNLQISVTGLAVWVALISTLILAWRILNWAWLKPKKLERYLRRQGLSGNPYRLLSGDLKEMFDVSKQAISKPLNLTDDIVPRVSPFFCNMMQKYGKNTFIWLGVVPRVILRNPEHIKEVFIKINDFKKPGGNPLAKYLLTGLLTREGEKWVTHRRIINQAFLLEKLKNMVPAFCQSCSDLISKWEEFVSVEEWCEVDVWPYLTDLTSDVISRTAFGSSHQEGRRIFQLQDELAELTRQVLRSFYIPGLRFVPTKLNKRLTEINKEIQVSLRGIISKRERAMKAGEFSKNDLLGILLEANSKEIQEHADKKNTGMSINDVIEECKIFYFAGQETTSVLLVWTMVLLAQHTNWQSRAREEVLQVFGKNKPDFDGLNQLKVVTMILYEVLRFYPPVVGLGRSVDKETRIGDLVLPAGVEVALPTIHIHRDPTFWGEDAGQFKPERFADGVSKAMKNQVAFFPFAWGPRICIGQNFALIEAKMALSMMLQHFRFELSPSYTHAPYLVITMRPQHGAHLILRKL
ncbi:cytochrome P450 CYP72A219-like [Carica papaya]|uniref:cytochrome P450 CYP72A219-like n=1 Tax=Carica papaya TaxID=3649 RepID=UPI000B8CE3CF|nr:cytochrome P450 CYP72A219-like [Carica papaya]